MDRLFCPWRYAYVTAPEPRGAQCILCELANRERSRDREGLVVYRADHYYVVLNRYPYNTGHLMIVPYRHVERLSDLPMQALPELSMLMARAEGNLAAEYHAEGINLGLNVGRFAGAGISRHLHAHVVPRWAGDTSFMTVTGETRVLPEALDDTWVKLRRRFGSDAGPES